jgi:DNA-binding MarR family transcriptional regulator
MCRKTERARLMERILELEQKAFKALHPFMPQEWSNLNLTMPQFRVLLVLFADGPTSMSVLSSTLGVAMATATGIVDRLVGRGLVTREGHPEDRRVVVCRLSEEGQELVGRLRELGQVRAKSFLENMTTAELKLLAKAMETILRASAAVERDLRQKQEG